LKNCQTFYGYGVSINFFTSNVAVVETGIVAVWRLTVIDLSILL